MNGGPESGSPPWMMGASLNPDSRMHKEMSAALDDEIKTHGDKETGNSSGNNATGSGKPGYLGVPFPGRKRGVRASF